MESTGKKIAPPKAHHGIHSRPATATNSRRRAAKHVPRVSPYSLASIDPGFVKNRPRTALAISKNDECYTHTDRRADELKSGTLYALRYEKAFCPKGKKTTSVALLPRPCLNTSREVNEARGPHTCTRPCAFERKKNRKKNKTRKNPAPPKTPHEIHSIPATATTSRRRVTKHVPCVSPYSPASIDPGFVEIGFALVKTMLHIHRQTDYAIK